MLKRIPIFLLFMLLSLGGGIAIYAQTNAQIEIIDGNEFYRYKVEPGEGLYAISKKFGVTQAEINNLNPQIHDGLKAGMEILIPNKLRSGVSIQDTQSIRHTVEKKQTLFAISRKYNTTVEALVAANPEITKTGIRPGDVLIIPGGESDLTIDQQDSFDAKVTDSIITHLVKAQETLYGISKTHGISVELIQSANPHMNTPLHVGEKLIIPKGKKRGQAEVASSTENKNLQTHRVKAGETLYSISRLYGVSVNQLMAYNPGSAETLKAGTVLQIYPSGITEEIESSDKSDDERNFFQRLFGKKTEEKEQTSETASPATDDTADYYTHKVRLFETLYSISRKHNVTVDQLRTLNPEASEKLKVGTILKIKPRFKKPAVLEEQTQDLLEEKKLKEHYKVAYLLPFMSKNENDPTAYKFIEFYMGSLLAANNAKNSNMKFDIYAYDIEKTDIKLREVLSKQELKTMDLIIGPAYTAQIETLAGFAKLHKIPTVIPFSSKVNSIGSNPYLFQFNPEQNIQNEFLLNTLSQHFSGAQIVLVETERNTAINTDSFYEAVKSKHGNDKNRVTTIQIADFDRLDEILHRTKKNIFIFDTDNYNRIKNYLDNLHSFNKTRDVVVIGQYAWREKEGTKPKMFYISPFKGNKKASDFYENNYNKFFGDRLAGDNPRFDLIGYDLSSLFLSQMSPDGFRFDLEKEMKFSGGVQSEVHFTRNSTNNGFMNQKLYLIADDAVD